MYGNGTVWANLTRQSSPEETRDSDGHASADVGDVCISEEVPVMYKSEFPNELRSSSDNNQKGMQITLKNLTHLARHNKTELEKYGIVLRKQLGQGHFGAVWKATYHGKTVALKLLKVSSVIWATSHL